MFPVTASKVQKFQSIYTVALKFIAKIIEISKFAIFKNYY